MQESDLFIEYINTPNALGLAIRRIRKKKGHSQKEVAKIFNMRQSTISDIENGRGTLRSFFMILQALKVNLALSTTGIENRKKNKGI